MRTTTLLNKLLQLPGLWVQAIRFEDDTLIIEGPIRRLRCPQCCTVRTEAVPWARHRSAFTRSFEDAVGLLAQKLDHTAVAALTDVAWVTVGSIAERLVGEHLHEDRFDELSDEQLDSIELVSIDMSAAYIKAIEQYLPDATVVFDRFHVARLTQIAVDEVRRVQMRALDPEDSRCLKRTRWLLLKRPEHLGIAEKAKLNLVRRANNALYRAYLLKETFLDIFDYKSPWRARRAIEAWIAWAQRSRLKPFVRLARTVRKHLDGILAFIDSRLTNARLEGMNNKIRLLSHRGYGFHSADPLIATVYLGCSKITLPELQLRRATVVKENHQELQPVPRRHHASAHLVDASVLDTSCVVQNLLEKGEFLSSLLEL